MTVNKTYSLSCTDCGSTFYESGTGSWHFEDVKEVTGLAIRDGWSIAEIVPNGSEWDFCPRCIKRRDAPAQPQPTD